MINPVSEKYIEQLTWLRGLAAFFVIVSHTMRATEVKYSQLDQASSFLPLSILDMGSFGVILFFVLSGCTLYISNENKVGRKQVVNFYIKRVFRIWPAFLVALMCFIAFMPIFTSLYVDPAGHWIEKQYLTSYSFVDVFSYLTLTFNITGPSSLFNNAFWSLPVEFQYYLIFPLLIFSLRYIGITGPILFGLALYLLPKLGIIQFENNDVFTLAFSFCGGILVGYYYKKTEFRLESYSGMVLLFIFVLIASAVSSGIFKLPDLPIVSNKWNWFGGLGIATVFVALFTRANFHSKLERFLKHYGTISYSTYLYHNLFVAISVLFIIQNNVYDGYVRLIITFFFTLAASFIVATASYKYVEAPFIRIGKNIVNRRSS